MADQPRGSPSRRCALRVPAPWPKLSQGSSMCWAALASVAPAMRSSTDIHKKGPLHWSDVTPTCGLNQQSPINLDTFASVPSYGQQLKGTSYGSKFKATLRNSGTSVYVEFSGNNLPTIFAGSLPKNEKFVFGGLHFHWSSQNSVGSEHSVDDTFFAGEIHLVHWNSKYGSFEKAAEESDGLAVVAFFIKVSKWRNPKFDAVIRNLGKVDGSTEARADIGYLSLSSLLPRATNYFFYKGSLTTPPCSENVFWTIFLDPVYLSEKQLNALRSVHAPGSNGMEGKNLSNNFRPLQQRNGRQVYLYNPKWNKGYYTK